MITPMPSLNSDSPAIWISSCLGGSDGSHDGHDGNGIGRRDQGAKQRGVHERDAQADPAKYQPGQSGGNEGGGQVSRIASRAMKAISWPVHRA